MSKYIQNIFSGLKKICLGVLDRGDRDKNNETDWKEGGIIKMSTTVLHSRCSLLRLIYLPNASNNICGRNCFSVAASIISPEAAALLLTLAMTLFALATTSGIIASKASLYRSSFNISFNVCGASNLFKKSK
jgi:hypothetical protein